MNMEEGRKELMLDMAHASSKDMQENPDKYYDLDEKLYTKIKNKEEFIAATAAMTELLANDTEENRVAFVEKMIELEIQLE